MSRSSTALLALLLLAGPAAAQNVGSPEVVGSQEVAQLRELIETLTARVKKLEERLDKPLNVKAPFTVTDAKGTPLMKVTDTAQLTLGRSAQNVFRVQEDGGGMQLSLRTGNVEAGMATTSGGARVVAVDYGSGRQSRLIVDSVGSVVDTQQQGEIAQLGIVNGSSRIKLWHGNAPWLIVDSEKSPSFKFGDANKPALEIAAAADKATLTLKNGQGEVMLNTEAKGVGEVRAIGGGAHLAVLGALPNMTGIQVSNAISGTADDWIQLGLDAEEGPRLRIYEGGKKVADLGTPIGKQPGLRIYDEQGKVALHAGLGSAKGSRPSFTVLENDDVVAVLGANDNGEGLVQIAKPGRQIIAELGRTTNSKGNGLRIWDESNDLVLGAGTDANNVPSVRLIQKGKVATNMFIDSEGAGRLDVAAGKAAVASIFAENGMGKLEVSRADGKTAAELGPGEDSKVALRILSGDGKALVGVGEDKDGDATVQVHDKSGEAVAALTASPKGGGDVAVYQAGSGEPLASLTGRGEIGYVHVYAPGTGQIATLTKGGSGGGLLQLIDAAGRVMVEGGSTGAIGVVRTGPMGRGSFLGLPGSYIMGKAQ